MTGSMNVSPTGLPAGNRMHNNFHKLTSRSRGWKIKRRFEDYVWKKNNEEK